MKWAWVLLIAVSLQAQAPHEAWRTIETTHFRVHHPVQYESWSRRAASRLESIRDEVVREVGYAPPQTIDVLVIDPIADANGFAIPLLDSPRLVFYTDPPGPDSQIGESSNWIDLLAVHEVAHLVHLLRPSRNPLRRAWQRFFPLGPITLGAPRWVTEGYATVVEGRVTGSGRPPGAIRAAILRKWAASGRLPSYGELGSSRRFLGMSMAYLAGSAFLEWLEKRSGEGSLKKLWLRMSARQRRSFEQAFEGAFGDRPDRLYGLFTAELTAEAMRRGDGVEGTMFQETSWNSGEPAVSPDDAKIAVVIRKRDHPARLVIWATGEPEEERKKQEKTIAEMLARDPLDVAPVASKPLPRKELYALVMPGGGDIESPRWMSGGEAILFVHRQPDVDGVLHRDLFRWTPATGAVERLTHLADVKDADPSPDGTRAVAVRNRFGFSQLVVVDLTTGIVSSLTPPSLDRVYSHPRVHADGRRIVYAAHSEGAWRLYVRTFEGAEERLLFAAEGGNVASPEWNGSSVVATVSTREAIDLHQIEDVHSFRITRTSGGAFDPAPFGSRVFYMSLEPDGFVLRKTRLRAAERERLVRPGPPAMRTFASQPVESRHYGFGRPEWNWLMGGVSAPAFDSTEIGVRVGDVVGRFDAVAIASAGGRDAPRGGSLAVAWRGLPVELSSHLFRVDGESGAELRVSRELQFPLHALSLSGGALAGERSLAFLDGSVRARRVRGMLRFDGGLRVAGEFGDEVRHARAEAGAGIRRGATRAALRVRYDTARDAIALGGVAPSVLPLSALADRVLDPALPFAYRSGDRYRGARVEIARGPMTAFVQEHRLTGRTRVAGAEIAMRSDPLPLLRFPAFDLLLGAARVMPERGEDENAAWAAIRWRP